MAIFARGGASPLFLPLQFRVPLPHWLAVAGLPNIYHLVELKDNYHRYVVLLSTEESARIVEVNLGAATEELWTQRPELRQRVGREWTKEHYQSHLRHQTERFIKESIAMLEQLMAAGGHTHLILAGNAQMTGQFAGRCPRHWRPSWWIRWSRPAAMIFRRWWRPRSRRLSNRRSRSRWLLWIACSRKFLPTGWQWWVLKSVWMPCCAVRPMCWWWPGKCRR
ncbi:MAG: hypothetical protein HC875_40630 [Anaerolineales bacterium]|nr:hypothetical protein [Anaerolineales bacterium]